LDLSFSRFEADAQVTVLPPDLAVMLVGIAARQAVSPTARRQALLARPVVAAGWFQPTDGCFNGIVAARLAGWRKEAETPVNPPFTEPL
jgi:hypothetical protein